MPPPPPPTIKPSTDLNILPFRTQLFSWEQGCYIMREIMKVWRWWRRIWHLRPRLHPSAVSLCTTLPLPQGPVLPFILCILLVLILLSIHTITITVDNAVNTDNTFCIVDDTVSIISILVATKPPVPPLLIVQLAVQTRFKIFLEILGDTKRYLVQFGSS